MGESFTTQVQTLCMSRSESGAEHLPISLPSSNGGIGVLAGDLLGIAVLVSIGLMRHNTPGLFQSPNYAASRILPFVMAWLIVSPVFGLFADTVVREYKQLLVRVVVAWTGAAVLGALFRDVLTTGGASPVFVAVMIGFGLLVMVPWRLAVAALFRRQR